MKPVLASLVAVSVAATCSAQAAPPKQVAKFDRLIGVWSATGTAVMEPGMPAMPWTSTSHVRKVMNGHFVRDDMVIEFGDALPGSIQFTTFFGYDIQNKKFKQLAVDNMGGLEEVEIHWVDNNTMVTSSSKIENGQPVVDRWVTRLGDGKYSFVGHRAVGGGEFFEHVKGVAVISKAVEAAAHKDESFNIPAPPKPMDKLARMKGRYSVKGEMVQEGVPEPIPITGDQTIKPIFGGTVLEMLTTGQPGNYEAWAVMVWSEQKQCYHIGHANSWGEFGLAESRWIGEKLITTHAGTAQGKPVVHRSILMCDASGAVTGGTTHMIAGDSDPLKIFWSTYTKQ